MLAGLVIAVFKSIFRVCSSVIGVLYFGYFRPAYKRFLRRLTGQCELERILSSSKFSMAKKIRKIEYSLKHSKDEDLKKIPTVLYEVETKRPSSSADVDDSTTNGGEQSQQLRNLVDRILRAKSIDTSNEHGQWFRDELLITFRMIVGYRTLMDEVETERTITYDSTNPEHEELLMKLWTLLRPDDDLHSRVSYQWTEIGFQGDDPATDFRGMGILGLKQLVYFGESRGEKARRLLSISNHPTKGYPFAIVGISMTSLARDLLREGSLRNHFFNTVRRAPKLEDFHRLYCELFSIFDCYWTKTNPQSIMEFVPVRRQFHTALRDSLSWDEAVLQEAKAEEFGAEKKDGE